jgi:hypothetical protein
MRFSSRLFGLRPQPKAVAVDPFAIREIIVHLRTDDSDVFGSSEGMVFEFYSNLNLDLADALIRLHLLSGIRRILRLVDDPLDPAPLLEALQSGLHSMCTLYVQAVTVEGLGALRQATIATLVETPHLSGSRSPRQRVVTVDGPLMPETRG